MKYKEIFKLKEMLEELNIPFEYKNRSMDIINIELHQIAYPNFKDRVCSIIEGFGTYGEKFDKLEIMGLLTDEELEDNCVIGNLTAEEVLERISEHYKITSKGDDEK